MRYIISIILFIFFLTITPSKLNSQVRISVDIENYDDSIFYLFKYKNDKSLSIIDTSSVSQNKKVFINNDNYDEGIYILADSKQLPLFEILIGKDQKFSVHVEELMDLNTYKAKGSKETSKYFEINSKISHNRLHIKALESEMEYFPDNKRKIDSIKLKHNEYLQSMFIVSRNHCHFLNTYNRLNKEIIVPEGYKDDKEQYLIDHYFDDVLFGDTRILNSSLLKNKLDYFFNNHMHNKKPEVICKNIDSIIDKTYPRLGMPDYEIRDYVLWYLYSKYFNPENIENELVYIYLIDKYFSKFEIENMTENIRNEMKKRADVLRKITIGQTAPALSYIDDKGNEISLKDVDSEYTVLFFYKPECQKCIRDKRILGLIEKGRTDLTVLEINISEENYNNVSYDIVEKYDIMTTPTIYLLNENKEIIAKHIKSEEVEFHINKK